MKEKLVLPRRWMLLPIACLMSVALAQLLVIDGSTVESYERSVRMMADSLPEEDREVFGRGLLSLIVTEYPPARGASPFEQLQMIAAALEAAHITTDGRTLDEILERGRSLESRSTAESRSASAELQPEESPSGCLKQMVTVEAAEFQKGDFSDRVVFSIRNGLAWPIAGIRIAYRAFSEGRSVPWMDKSFSISISGGIEPGEVRAISTTARVPREAPEELRVEARILDVADAEMRLLLGDARVMGWSDERSPLPCLAVGLGAAAGPDGSTSPTGSPAPARTPFQETLERPMAVVVDNVAGYPQHGIGSASQVHEMPVEGGLTRLMQIYDRSDPERVGPVRGARDYMVELSRSMDAVLVHDGGSPGALAAIRATNAPSLNSFTSGELFSRGDGRAPYNLFAGGDALRAAIDQAAMNRGRTVTGVIYRPDAVSDDVPEVRVRFGGTYETGFSYEPAVNAYRWIRNGEPASDASGQAVLVDAVLVASVEARPIPNDAEGRLYLPLRGGPGTLFVRGKLVEGEWSLRSGLGVQFSSAEGGIDLTPFKLWVVYTPYYGAIGLQ